MTAPDRFIALGGGPTSDERDARLAAGADALAGRRTGDSLFGGSRLLLTISASMMTFGLCLVLLGWLGAAHSTLIEEQIPYLISGGLLGLAVATIGAMTFFAHWITVLVRESRLRETVRRQDHAELVAVIRELMGKLDSQEAGSDGSPRGTPPQRPLRRPSRGS